MQPDEVLAFVDTVEFLERTEARVPQVSIRLDVVPATARLDGRTPELDRDWQPSMVEIEPGAIATFGQSLGVVLDDLEGRWFRVVLGSEGLPARRYASPIEPGVATRVGSLEPLHPRVEAQVARLSELDSQEFPDATPQQIDAALRAHQSADRVACYHVGQGNLNAICDASAQPLVYYDLGGGALANAKTYPSAFRACTVGTPPVLLSHWDTDHWVTARKDPRWLSHTWIAPRQKVGPTHRQLARDIKQNGTLLMWPSAVASRTAWFGEVARCTGTSRNDSGLAARIDLASGDRVLLPGDADYGAIPAALTANLNGLVAAHHGAAMKSAPPAAQSGPAPSAYVAISYGARNSYKHPASQARADLRAAGWRVQYLTPNGGVQFLAHTPKQPPCSGGNCSLKTPKP